MSCLNSYRRDHITDSLQVEEGALSAFNEKMVKLFLYKIFVEGRIDSNVIIMLNSYIVWFCPN